MKRVLIVLCVAVAATACQGSYYGLSRTIVAQSPLHDAAALGDVEAAADILDAGTDPDIEVHEGITPLMVAAQYAQNDVSELLLNAGANVNAVSLSGASPLFMAAQNGFAETVRLLIARGAVVNHWVQAGQRLTPLLTAILHGNRDVVRILLSHGADPLVEVDGMNAAELARANGQNRIADLIDAFVTARRAN